MIWWALGLYLGTLGNAIFAIRLSRRTRERLEQMREYRDQANDALKQCSGMLGMN